MKIRKIEAIRGFAALYVVLNHYIGNTILKDKLPSILKLPFHFGQEAVIVFFLISGFVIYLSSVQSRSLNFRKYFLKRFIRIYPIVIAAFILSITVVLINRSSFKIDDAKSLIGNFLMLQDSFAKPGYIVLPFLGNDPLWTLSYEWWFYMMFYPIFFYLIRINKIRIDSAYVVLLISMGGWAAYLFYPNHLFLILAYFSLWWSGVVCAEAYLKTQTFTFKGLIPAILPLIVMACLTVIPIITTYRQGGNFRHMIDGKVFSQITDYTFRYPVITFRHYLSSLMVILIGLAWWKIKLVRFDFIFGWFAKLSPISYALYITHFIFIGLNIPLISNPYVAILIKLFMTFCVSYLLEIKLQPIIKELIFKKNIASKLVVMTKT